MVEQILQGRRILVVEDEYFLADEVRDALTDAGAEVLGPVPSVEDATALLATETHIDAAVLDVNLRGDLVFPVADALKERGVPFAFATGYDPWTLPARFADTVRVEKPLQARSIASALGPLFSRKSG
jgi:DNA-binding response OmpR family regulator